MTTFTIAVTEMSTLPQVGSKTDVVVTVQYKVSGTDGIYTADANLTENYTIQQDGSFTPYADLTESQVAAWISESALAGAKAYVEIQIDSFKSPPVTPAVKALPWFS
jgi:hypothetical protein